MFDNIISSSIDDQLVYDILSHSLSNDEIENIHILKSVNLKFQLEQLVQRDILLICKALEHFQNLEFLNFSLEYSEIQNKKDLKQLFNVISKMKSVKHIRLYFVNIDLEDSHCIYLGNCLENMSQLENVDISLHRNKISEVGANALIQPFCNMLQLQSLQLNLNYNRLKDRGCIALAQGLQNLKNLEKLRIQLWSNQIGNIGAEDLGECLGKLYNLKVLSIQLSNNNIGDQGLIGFAKGISMLQRLSCLDLDFSYNKVQDGGFLKFSHSLESLRDLVLLKINFKYNHISLSGEQQLFRSLIKPSSLLQYQIYIDDDGIQDFRLALNEKIRINQFILNRQILIFEAYFKHIAPSLPGILISPISNHWDFFF